MAQRIINPILFSKTAAKLREFFLKRGFVECHPQSAVSILAACEDPTTISTYDYSGVTWPLPQTGQMWLEDALLKNPQLPGLFCLSTSYRNEQNPIPGRHEKIFPMFEFEQRGDFKVLKQLEKDLLMEFGFGRFYNNDIDQIPEGEYVDMMKKFNTNEIKASHEGQLAQEYGPAFLLKHFPVHTSPFWNMKINSLGLAEKIDVILQGHETIGSAERSCDKDVMRDMFYNISEGGYAKILFAKFGKDRIERELDEFFSHDFFPRFGGGIGMTRMINALEKSGLIDDKLEDYTTQTINEYKKVQPRFAKN